MQSKLIEQLSAELPPIIVRSQIEKLTGNLVSRKTLSNADWEGRGPKERAVVANKVVYSRNAFIQWLREYFEPRKNCQHLRGGYVQRR